MRWFNQALTPRNLNEWGFVPAKRTGGRGGWWSCDSHGQSDRGQNQRELRKPGGINRVAVRVYRERQKPWEGLERAPRASNLDRLWVYPSTHSSMMLLNTYCGASQWTCFSLAPKMCPQQQSHLSLWRHPLVTAERRGGPTWSRLGQSHCICWEFGMKIQRQPFSAQGCRIKEVICGRNGLLWITINSPLTVVTLISQGIPEF